MHVCVGLDLPLICQYELLTVKSNIAILTTTRL